MPLSTMKALIQRVARGAVTIDGEVTGTIGRGLVVLLGVREGDTEQDAQRLAERTVNMRIFPDQQDRMNRSVRDVEGAVLVISQFTLYADTRKGNRPSFIRAGVPARAEALYNRYVAALRAELGPNRVATGRFGAMMQVELVNDGPVTLELTTD
jgi:D-aminoacyl-tRNA deacylase